jgi:hypothetical protein
VAKLSSSDRIARPSRRSFMSTQMSNRRQRLFATGNRRPGRIGGARHSCLALNNDVRVSADDTTIQGLGSGNQVQARAAMVPATRLEL